VEINQLAPCITCHAFNADRSRVALCPNNNEIHIFGRAQGGGWALEAVLKEHDQTVLGLDWAPQTDRIVSCSQDRNAYVWTFTAEGRWQPMLVILRINRAATCVKWSPQENKFAVASGAKVVSVCHFEEEGNWWIAKHIKKHRSTVLSVDWHPNNLLIATGSSDFRCRIFCAAIKGVDSSNKSEFFAGKAMQFGELLAELDQVQGWVHSVAWSPNGTALAFTGHDARLAVADVRSDPPAVETIKLHSLPFMQLMWLNDAQLCAVGHEPNPTVFAHVTGRWQLVTKLDKPQEKQTKQVGAMSKFQNMEKVGQESRDSTLATQHQNMIRSVSIFEGTRNAVIQIATTGNDGKLIVWNAPV